MKFFSYLAMATALVSANEWPAADINPDAEMPQTFGDFEYITDLNGEVAVDSGDSGNTVVVDDDGTRAGGTTGPSGTKWVLITVGSVALVAASVGVVCYLRKKQDAEGGKKEMFTVV